MSMQSVVVRRYGSEQDFSRDASSMARAGWRIAAQTQGSAMSSLGAVVAGFGVLLALGGLLFWIPLILIGLVLILVGAVSRRPTYTVTYQPG